MTYSETEALQNPVEVATVPDSGTDSFSEKSVIPEKITMQYILRCIREVQEDTVFLYSAIEKLGTVKSEGPGDVGTAAKANALSHAVEEHEKTNRRLIDFYERLYGDLYREQLENTMDLQQKAMRILADSKMDCAILDSLSSLFDTNRHING